MNAGDYIGVFDSGVGGISVLRHLVRVLPNERFLYFGDSANAPYGAKSKQEVLSLTLAAVETLRSQGIKALVVACNTATAAAIDELRKRYPDLIVIGIEPALKLAADTFPGGNIGVMATSVTLREEKFARLMDRFRERASIHTFCPEGLVELVESGKANSEEAEALLRSVFAHCEEKLDALVLGCTHYPFASAALQRVLGSSTVLLDGGDGTARETRRRLEIAGLLHDGPGEVRLCSSAGDAMIALSRRLLEE